MITIRDRSLQWLYQRVSAALLAVFLLLHYHLFVKRFVASGGISYDDLMARLSSPVFKIIELSFIFLAITHGFYGVWTVVETFIHNNQVKRFLYWMLWITGVCLFLFTSAMILLL